MQWLPLSGVEIRLPELLRLRADDRQAGSNPRSADSRAYFRFADYPPKTYCRFPHPRFPIADGPPETSHILFQIPFLVCYHFTSRICRLNRSRERSMAPGLLPHPAPLQVGLEFCLSRHAHLELPVHGGALQFITKTELRARLR